jgi:hypothetical protein
VDNRALLEKLAEVALRTSLEEMELVFGAAKRSHPNMMVPMQV